MKKRANQEFQTRPDGSLRVYSYSTKKSRTQKQFRDQCDINLIVAKYDKNYMRRYLLQPLSSPQFADFSQVTDYHTMVTRVQNANDSFQNLPSKLRARFKNDPGLLLQFLSDPKNYDEGVSLGLFEPKKQDVALGNNDAIQRDDTAGKPPASKKAPSPKNDSAGGAGE